VRERRELVAGRWPVLARLPQVDAEPSPRLPSSRTSIDDGSHDYRFDPPQAHHASHMNVGGRAVQAGSSILPNSNPFAIPAASLLGRLGPAIRFLLLIALFTIAGMILLTGGKKETPSARDKIPADAAALRPALEPAATTVNAELPTATGPASSRLSSADHEPIDDPNAPDLADLEEDDDYEAADDVDDIHVQRESREETNSPYPQTAWPAASMPWTDQDPLPQARMNDPAPPIAHLPGYITELAPRQASNDDNQQSLH
jgi:hypothetical protein